MKNNDWTIVYNAMEEVDYLIPRTSAEQNVHATASLENYPPRIEIVMTCRDSENNRSMPHFTSKELEISANLLADMVSKALGRYPWLTVVNMANPPRLSRGYVVKPKSYEGLSDSLKDG